MTKNICLAAGARSALTPVRLRRGSRPSVEIVVAAGRRRSLRPNGAHDAGRDQKNKSDEAAVVARSRARRRGRRRSST